MQCWRPLHICSSLASLRAKTAKPFWCHSYPCKYSSILSGEVPLNYSKKTIGGHIQHTNILAWKECGSWVVSCLVSCVIRGSSPMELYSRNLSFYPQICHHFIKFSSRREALETLPTMDPQLTSWGAGYSVQRDLVNEQDCWPRKTYKAG